MQCSGEIYGIFDQSDREKLSFQVRSPEKPEPGSPADGWEAVVSLIQRKLHFVISMSASGETFRQVLSMHHMQL